MDKYDGYKSGLVSMVCKLFDKKSAGSDVNTHANKSVFLMSALLGLAEELHKSIIRKFKKRTVYSRFKDNIWGTD